MTSKDKQVDISIIIATYFHESYIEQALNSILSQETALQFEVLIGDDASSDRTPEILRRYAVQYPDVIRLVLREKNVGANRNGCDLRRRAKGNYLAFLGGDDFWLDPQKLQKQWTFLESNPEYVGCCGKSLIVDENSQCDYTQAPHFVWNKKVFTLKDLIDSWNIPGQTSTLMARNIFRGIDPKNYAISYLAHPQVGDKTLMLLLLAHGPIYCSNEILSSYRRVVKKDAYNWFSIHYRNPYRNYDMFMYPCRLETWARKNLQLPKRCHLGKRDEYRFCRYIEECVKEPSLKRLKYAAEMILQSHQPIKYAGVLIKALIQLE